MFLKQCLIYEKLEKEKYKEKSNRVAKTLVTHKQLNEKEAKLN